MNTKELRKQIKNDELIRLEDGSKVSVLKEKNRYYVSFEKLDHAIITCDTLKETIEYIESINNKR